MAKAIPVFRRQAEAGPVMRRTAGPNTASMQRAIMARSYHSDGGRQRVARMTPKTPAPAKAAVADYYGQ